MQRYKILLVDDETDVRQSIALTVDWEAEGFVLCGCAGGALEAMELARRLLPDVVMTDICMPYMDGLELTERLRELYPAMQFVIVSGYDEFEYAQRAVKAQVMDYLLKPLSADGVREALRRIRAKLDSNMARSRDLESLREEARQDRLQLERTQLMELLLEARGETGEALKAERYFPARLALMELAGAPENERVLQEDFQGDRMLLDFSLQQLAQELLQEGDQGICVLHRGRLVVLLREEEDVLRLAERVADTLRMVLGLSVKTAMSCRMEDARMLPGMYQRALLLVGNEATYDAGSVFLMEEELQQDAALTLTDSLPGEIAQLLRSGDEGRCAEYFARMRADLEASGVSPALLEALQAMVKSAVFTTALRCGVASEALYPALEKQRVHYPLETGPLLDSLCAFACAACRRIASMRAQDSQRQAGEIARYIEENFGDANLSIPGVCEKFRISQTQLSLLFKREMGTSFLQYVLDKRIARAKELLLSSDKKIYEIALETGFEDPGYFSYCFKQRCGMTPKNFRQGADGG